MTIYINSTIDSTIRAVVDEALRGLRLGLSEDAARASVTRELRRVVERMSDSNTGFLLPDYVEWIDDVLHDMIREGEILQRVIGGRVRLVLAEYVGDGGDGR